jgi:hypothetical protein
MFVLFVVFDEERASLPTMKEWLNLPRCATHFISNSVENLISE